MSEMRRQDLVYPPGPEAQREQDQPGRRPEVQAPTTTGRLLNQLWFVRHDEEAILRVLRQVSRIDRLHARIALFQALGGQYASAGPRALALCERVFGAGTMYFPSEREMGERKDRPSPDRLTRSRPGDPKPDPEPTTVPEPEAAFEQGRIRTLCELLERRLSQSPVPSASEILALLDAAESHVAKAALSRLSSTQLPGEDGYGKTYYQALKQAAGEAVSDHLTGRREVIERMLPRWHKAGRPKDPPPLPLETRLLKRGGAFGGGQVLGSWDKSPTPEVKAQRYADAEESLAGDHPALAMLGQGGGEPLPEAVLGRMNRLFGHDFSHVRIHTDAKAADVSQLLGARALAFGTHVYFGAGQFAPGTPAGDRLLAHELMHVVQHDRGRLSRAGGDLAVSQRGDPSEREAEAAESLPTNDGVTSKAGGAAARAPEARNGSPSGEAHASTVHRKAQDADTDGSSMSLWGVLKQLASLGWSTLLRIVRDPLGFVSNLFSGVKAGLRNFVSNIGGHLKEGLFSWLTGSLGQAGIELPKTLDEKGIFSLAAQLLQVTYQNIRARAAKRFGEPVVARLEKASALWKTLTKGPAALWEQLKEQLTSLPGLVMGTIKDFVLTRIITAGIEWILSLLNPASALAKVAMAVYRIIKFFVERAAQIAALGQAVLQSLEAIARGAVAEIAKRIEAVLVRALPVVIGFLASLLRLDGIGERIRKLLAKVRVPVEKALDWVIEKAWKLLQRAGKALGIGQKGKDRKEKAAGKEEKAIGTKIRFQARGETHTTWVDASGAAPVAMVASTPSTVRSLLQQSRPRLAQLPRDQSEPIGRLIGKGLAIEKAVDKLAVEAKASGSVAKLESKLRELANVLQQLFEQIPPGSQAGPVARFEPQLGAMPKGAGAYAREQLKSADPATVSGEWSKVQAWLKARPGFQQILGEGSRVGEDTKMVAQKGAATAVAKVAPAEQGKAGDIVDRSKPRVHARLAPYESLHDQLTEYAFHKERRPLAEGTAETAYDEKESPDTQFVLAGIPKNDEELIAKYDAVVLPLIASGAVKGKAEGLRNQFVGAIKSGQVRFSGGFRTQLQQVLAAATNVPDRYPQLASVEVRVAGSNGDRRADFTQWHSKEEKEKKEAIIYEVKNWTGWDSKTARERVEILEHFRAQVTDYLNADESKDGHQRFSGVKLQIKGKVIPEEAQEIIDRLQKTAATRKKTFSYGFIQ